MVGTRKSPPSFPPSSSPCKRCKTTQWHHAGTAVPSVHPHPPPPPPPPCGHRDQYRPSVAPFVHYPPSAATSGGSGPYNQQFQSRVVPPVHYPPGTTTGGDHAAAHQPSAPPGPYSHYDQSSSTPPPFFYQLSNAQPPSGSVPCQAQESNYDRSSFIPPAYHPTNTAGAGAVLPRPSSHCQPRFDVPPVHYLSDATGTVAMPRVIPSSHTQESNLPPAPYDHYQQTAPPLDVGCPPTTHHYFDSHGMCPRNAASIESSLRRFAPGDIHVSLEPFPYHLCPSTWDTLHLISHATLVSKTAASQLLMSGPPGTQIYQETLAMALAKEYDATLLIYDPPPTAETQEGVLTTISRLVQRLHEECKHGPVVLLLSDIFVNDMLKSLDGGIASPSDLKGVLHRIPIGAVLLGSHVLAKENSAAEPSDVSFERSVHEFFKGDRLSEVFYYKVVLSAPEDEAQALSWKQKLDKDVQTLTARRNRAMIRYILGTSPWSCSDLHAVCMKDRMLPPEFAGKMLAYAVLHHLNNNKPGSVLSGESIEYGFRLLETIIGDAAAAKGSKKSFMDDVAKNKYEMRLLDDVIPPDEIGVAFEDVGALDNVKRALRESVMLPLQRPELFSRGQLAKPCRGILLFGPPGTGKTMLAKAVATEADANFINVSMSSLTSKYYGEEEKYAKAVFTLASKLAPCVVFVDEVDSMLSTRDSGKQQGASSRLKNEFMMNWDGLCTKGEERVLVLGATNRPFDLDEAAVRRFQRRLMVGLPDAANREKILRVILSKEELAPDVDLAAVASMTDGYSGSDMKHLCVVAAHCLIREILEEEEKERSSALDSDGPPPALCSGAADVVVRPLRMDDFKYAHEQVGASTSSETANMSRLIDWNAQYGEGGLRKKRVLTYFC